MCVFFNNFKITLCMSFHVSLHHYDQMQENQMSNLVDDVRFIQLLVELKIESL
jgi:hypothetical protein